MRIGLGLKGASVSLSINLLPNTVAVSVPLYNAEQSSTLSLCLRRLRVLHTHTVYKTSNEKTIVRNIQIVSIVSSIYNKATISKQ